MPTAQLLLLLAAPLVMMPSDGARPRPASSPTCVVTWYFPPIEEARSLEGTDDDREEHHHRDDDPGREVAGRRLGCADGPELVCERRCQSGLADDIPLGTAPEVMPICTVDRKRVGPAPSSTARRAKRSPRSIKAAPARAGQ